MHFNFFQLFYKNNWNDFCHFSLKDKTFGMQLFLDLNKYNQLLPYFKLLVTLCRIVEFFKTSQNNRVTETVISRSSWYRGIIYIENVSNI